MYVAWQSAQVCDPLVSRWLLQENKLTMMQMFGIGVTVFGAVCLVEAELLHHEQAVKCDLASLP